MKRAHWQMIFRKFFLYLIFALVVLGRRVLDNSIKIDLALVFEISAAALLFMISFLKWLKFRFGYNDTEFCIKTGILIKREIFIPIKNISSIDTEKELVLGIFGGTLLRVDTEAGSYRKSDFEFPVYKKDAAEISAVSGNNAKRLYKANFRECVVSMATMSQARVGILLIIPVISRINRVVGVRIEKLVLDGLTAAQRISANVLPVLLTAIIYFLLIGWIVNFIYLTVQYLLLKVDFDENFITVRRGLIIKRRTVLRKKSVRAYIIRKPPLLMMLKRSRAHALCAGYGKERGEVSLLSPSSRDVAQKQILERLFPQEYNSSISLCPRQSAEITQKLIYFSWFSALTGAIFIVNILFPTNGVTPILYLVLSIPIAVKAIVYISKINATKISSDLKYACILKGYSLCEIYFPVTSPREVKIRQNIFQRITGSCNVKIYLKTEKRRSYTLRCADYGNACEFLEKLNINSGL